MLLLFGAVVLTFVDAEKLGDDHVVQGAKMDHAQDGEADEEAAFAQSTHISDPIEDVVDLPLDYLKVEIELQGHGNVHIVREFVRALARLKNSENSIRIASKRSPVNSFVLQEKICDLNFVDYFLSQLTIDRDPV